MRVFVINLRENADRRSSARAKFEAAGIRFEFFDAISGESAIDNRLFEGFDADEFLLNTGRTAAPGEIGCFASHRSLWKLAATINEPIMIMEDDFDLLDNFKDALCIAEAIIDRTGYLRLQTGSRARKRPIGTCNQFRVSRYTKAPHSTMCYCITPSVAQHFVDHTRIFRAPVDVFIRNFWEHRQPLFALTPYVVAPSVLSATPTIRSRKKRPWNLIPAVRRSLRKGRDYWRRWQFNLQQRFSPTIEFSISQQGELLGDHDILQRKGQQAGGSTIVKERECKFLS